MSPDLLTEKLLASAAGWEVIKHARSLVAADRVLSSAWAPPLLQGMVQAGAAAYRAGLVIRSEGDVENLCTCRESRDWGTICAHSVAVGLHFLKPAAAGGGEEKRGKGEKEIQRPSSPLPLHPSSIAKLLRDPAGTPIEISVIFPPDPADALARGKIMVFFEGRTAHGPSPLDALVKQGPVTLTPEDERLLATAEEIALGDTPGAMQLYAAQLATLLPALVDHPRVTLGKKRPLRVTAEPWRPQLKATLAATGEITVGMVPAARPPVPVIGGQIWLWNDDRVQPLALPPGAAAVLGGPLKLTRAQVPAFLSQTWPALAAGAEIEANFRLEDFELVPDPPRFQLHLAGGLAQLTGTLQAAYGPRIITPGITAKDDAAFMPDPQKATRYRMRDFAAEAAALDTLRRAGFNGPDTRGRLQLNGQSPVITFFARVFPRLERDWHVTLEERLDRSTKEKLDRLEPQFRVTPSGEQWFDLAVSYATSSGEVIPAAEVQRLLRGGQNGVRLKNGRLALLDTGAVEELEEILVDTAPEQRGGAYRMSAAQAGFFMASAAGQPAWKVEAPAAWRERVQQQTGEAKLECPPLGLLEGVLRDYQKQGVAWLRFLRENGFGGVLADEMGLGKTLQALAYVASVGPAARRSADCFAPRPGEAPGTPAEASRFHPFDRTTPTAVTHRHLPHWRQEGATYFVTCHLADSLPAERLGRWQAERDDWLSRNPTPWAEELAEEYHDRFGERLERWLDEGHGSCVLAQPELSAVVEKSLRYFDGQRYALGWFAIMPNHVHVVVRPQDGATLSTILHTWKSYTAKELNRQLGRTGALWQDETFDLIVRNERHLEQVSAYVRQNPAKAKLAEGRFRLGHGSAVGGPVLTESKMEDRRAAGPTLVVCPTSLVFNWQAEAAKFTPHLRVVALHGPDRHAHFDRVREADLVITTYALVRRDAERYRGIEFDTVILDEAQHIKNRQTQNAQAVKAVRCRHRLVLTGTPIENSVLDLWSIFDFLMPGYLGSAQDFRDRYEAPIARARDKTVVARLSRRLRPFILRRTKKEVAKELPPKLEQIAWCELTPAQAAVYGQLLAATRQEVNQAVGAQGLAKTRMLVLTALLRLRQVCCDLRLLGVPGETQSPASPSDHPGATKSPASPTEKAPVPDSDAATSGKLTYFTELLDEILDGGHRALVFSQFTSMLGLLRDQLTADGTPFCHLDGSTTNRGEVVQRFQNSPEIPVFLISLKAGGVGLNLTGADAVVHFDPWWNPAVEDQATDRAHRIGQTRTVTSYKLITRGTVEEKILALQQRKRELIAATLTGEDVFTARLNWEEIQELLA